MKKNLSAVAFLMAASINIFAQTSAKDSLRVVNLQEVQIVSTRATSKTPVAYSNISKKEIRKQNFGLDLPFLLTTTPSVLTTSDAGSGVGYTSIRVARYRRHAYQYYSQRHSNERCREPFHLLGEYPRPGFFTRRYANPTRSRHID